VIEVEASVALPRLGRGYRAIVDETDPTIARRIRGGLLIPVGPAPEEPKKDEAE
jgi:hypothetical protein